MIKDNKNYAKMMEVELGRISKESKPKLLLHVCCGPCFTIPYEEIKDYFDVTIFYNNSNIYPKSEHDRRLNELKRYLSEMHYDIPIIESPYDNEKFNIDLEPFKDLPEGHERCRICFRKRLGELFLFASQNNYQYCASSLTISRYKSAADVNTIGHELEIKFPNVKWLYADFKKQNGYEKSLLICHAHNLYFQEYCGCKYSYQKWVGKSQK